jgi:hypothetical protein
MVKMYRTKKYKQQIKKKTKKIYRGGTDIMNSNELNNDTLKENKIMEEVKNSEKFPSIMSNLNLMKPVSNLMEGAEGIATSVIGNLKKPISNIVNESVTLGEGLIEKGIEKAGDIVGVDVTQPQIVENKLQQIENIISNPKIKEEVSKIAEVAGEAMEPYIGPLEEKVIQKTKEVGEELGKSAVQIGLNTAEEIPGVGVVIGTLRSLDQAAKAGLSTVNAFTEVSKDTTDAINATAKNYKRLMEEKSKIGERINNSISEFSNPQSLLSKSNPLNINSTKTGGGFNSKKKYNKTKKYINKFANTNKYTNKYKSKCK